MLLCLVKLSMKKSRPVFSAEIMPLPVTCGWPMTGTSDVRWTFVAALVTILVVLRLLTSLFLFLCIIIIFPLPFV